MQYFSRAALLGAMSALCCTVVPAQEPARTCDRTKLPESDFLGCEGARLNAKAQALAGQANAQIATGKQISADCAALSNTQEARDCDLLSSDLIEDAAFKQAEANDLFNEAERMRAREADLRGKKN